MRSRIREALYQAVDVTNAGLDPDKRLAKSEDTPLYGEMNTLDSLSLVTLIITVEQKITGEFGVPITLADERSMLQEPSPFETIGSLMNYIELLLQEKGAESCPESS